MNARPVRHVIGISGGKDSAALAIWMKLHRPELDLEYFFCDTGEELPETYEYLTRLESFLGKPIARLNADRPFEHWRKVYGGYLPSKQMRWCTRQLKIRPLELWLGDDPAVSYVAIRADEDRLGYISTKPNISAVFPFKEEGVDKEGVFRILESSGVGVPKYYEWRTRSGCYFCFFQRKAEWLGLKERHPDLFEKAMAYEKEGGEGEPGFTWNQNESLAELVAPERAAEIRAKHQDAMRREQERKRSKRLVDVLDARDDVLADEDDEAPCLVCHV